MPIRFFCVISILYLSFLSLIHSIFTYFKLIFIAFV